MIEEADTRQPAVAAAHRSPQARLAAETPCPAFLPEAAGLAELRDVEILGHALPGRAGGGAEPDRAVILAEHEGKVFYEPLMEFMLSGDVVAIRLTGHRVIEGFRSIAGATDPTVAAAGTIRGDLSRDWGTKVVQNLVHGSDSVESAQRELALWF